MITHFFRRFVMFRTVFVASFFVLFFSLFGQTVPKAYSQDVAEAYMVKNVQVDILDQSAVKARNKAFDEAQAKAFSVLAERFRTADRNSIDKLPSPQVLSGLVQDFEILDEQASLKRYKGTYNFRFRPAAVRGFFGHGPTNFEAPKVVAPRKTILLLPYFQKDRAITIWSKNRNPLFAGIRLKLPQNSHIILPKGDISDKTDIRDGDPHRLNEIALNKIKLRYGASDVAIVLAQVSFRDPQTLLVTLMRTDREQLEAVSQYSYKETRPPQQGDANVFLQASSKIILDLEGDWKNTGIAETTPAEEAQQESAEEQVTEDPQVEANNSGLPSDPAVSPAGDENISPAAQALRNAIPTSPTGVANTRTVTRMPRDAKPLQPVGVASVFKVQFSGMPEWVDMQKQLRSIPVITSMEMISMKTQQAELHVTYLNWAQVQAALQQRGFIVEQDGEGYIIKRRQSTF